jgi:Na+-transporting NADH:ubiquinone oxidoreductase subunit A
VTPGADGPLADGVRDAASGCQDAHVVSVPLRYPFDDPALLARILKLPSGDGTIVWAVPVEGVLAVEAALGSGRPCVDRVVSVAGPAVDRPLHVSVPVGYPIEGILDGRVASGWTRVVAGGLLTGAELPPDQKGIDVECTGLTVLRELDTQTLLAFSRPGISRRSYSRTFVGSLRTEMAVRMNAGLAGEVRPCVSCGMCEDVCPAGILPAVIHKQLYANRLEEAQRLRVDLCVGCGLCSYVCPSKIDLRSELLRAIERLREEAALIKAEREAAEAAARAAEAEGDGTEAGTGGEADPGEGGR